MLRIGGLLFFCFLLFPAFEQLSCVYSNGPERELVAPQALEENAALEECFRELFSGCLGYTLIGEKPVSVEYCCGLGSFSCDAHRKKFFAVLEKVFATSTRFLLKTYHLSGSYSEVVLIDLPAFIRLAEKDRYLSAFIKKRYKTWGNFYKVLKNPAIHIFDCLDRNVVAIGIALGYGEENSRFYQRYRELGQYLRKYPLVCLLPFEPEPRPELMTSSPHARQFIAGLPYMSYAPNLAKKFLSLDQEWCWIQSVLDRYRNVPEVPYLFQTPFFVSKKGDTTTKVYRRYNKVRGRLSKLFYGRKFLDVVTEIVFPRLDIVDIEKAS